MPLTPTRYAARWLLPVSAPPIEHGALLVDGYGRIAAVGPDASVPTPEGVRQIDFPGCALVPGLVNVHAHPELTGMRGLLEDRPFEEWIPALRHVKLHAPLESDDLLEAARMACTEALAAGITTLGATEDSAAGFQALLDAGMRGVAYREVFGPAPEQAPTAIAELRARVEVMRQSETELVRVGISPHSPYTVSDALFRAAAALAREQQLPIAVHIAEAQVEQDLVVDGTGAFAAGLRRRGIATPSRARSPVALLEATGILELAPLLIHCVRVDDADIATIAAHRASVAHCPVANARLGHGVAPILQLRAAGVTTGIGTDSMASNNRMDVLEEARVAQILQRVTQHSPNALRGEDLLRMATLDGARALGIDRSVGSLEIGKDADLCVVQLSGPHCVPVHDPLAALFQSARGSDVVLTTVRGVALFRRPLQPAAPQEIEASAQRLRTALRAR